MIARRHKEPASASPEPRPSKEALLWLLLLAPGFLLAYSAANLYTAHLPPVRVGEAVMAWEQAIPFWPWTILPYMSINLLYAGSPFICATRQELRIHISRFALACAISISCFLLFPLRFATARPVVEGIPGLLFHLLELADRPYNQAPSLHISLLVILWSCYRRHCPQRWLWMMHLGFGSIAVSVLTTWQHHFLDLASGLVVGTMVCHLIPQPASAQTPARAGIGQTGSAG